MTPIEKLLSCSPQSLAPKPEVMPDYLAIYDLGPKLFHMLQQRNGFYAFETALHVFPLSREPGTGVEAWNAESLWRGGYGDLAEGLLFFSEDIFQDQFCLSKNCTGVLRFCAETGQTIPLADSLERWADVIVSNYKTETGWPLLHEWQAKFGPLPLGKRLMPRTPFFLGGEYRIENLWAGDPIEGMRLKADLAMQTRDLADGSQVKLNVTPKPE